jgi:hypothetical protein
VSVLQATAISQVLESFGEEEQELVMDILSKDYDWQTAIQSSTQLRERAFLLLDVSAVVKSHFHLQKLMPNVQLQYKVQHNRDPKHMHVDVTGAVTQTNAPFLTGLAKSYDQVTVDASALLVAHAGALCTRIIGVKVVGHTRHLYIDDGCYGSLCRDFKNSHQEHVPLSLFKNMAETQMTMVWGPTCDGLDRVCQNVFLPQMHVDNWLVFFDMGQSSGMGTAFNGFDPPDIVHYCVLGYSRQF